MIAVKAVLDRGECLSELDVRGHAEFNEAGRDILCSAVTILTRTAGRLFLSHLHENCDVSSVGRGSFSLKIWQISDERRDWAKGITEFLLSGLSDIERDYPAYIELEITIE